MDSPAIECEHPFGVNKVPAGWKLYSSSQTHELWISRKRKLSVMVTFELHHEKLWKHCSISSPKRLPTYYELVYMRKIWMGEEIAALMVLPTTEFHVNTDPNCLHLYACLHPSGNGLPEFSYILPGLERQI